MTTDEQKVSYGFGLQFGDQLLRNKFDGMDLDAVLAGVSTGMSSSRRPCQMTRSTPATR